MRVTVIPQDKFIQIDGVGFEPIEFDYDEGVHAIQWYGEDGHIEFVTPDGGVMTTPVSSMEVQPYIEAWRAEKERIEAIANTPITFEEAKAVKQAELSTGYDGFLVSIQPEYTALERDTWAKQGAEAGKVVADPAIDPELVPMLKAISDARSDVTLQELAQRVIANEKNWVKVSGHVTGQRHNFQKQLEAATTVEEVEAIAVTFSLPKE